MGAWGAGNFDKDNAFHIVQFKLQVLRDSPLPFPHEVMPGMHNVYHGQHRPSLPFATEISKTLSNAALC